MASENNLISLGGLKTFKDNYDVEIDEKIEAAIGGAVNTTYTLTKNNDGEIVLSGSDGSTNKVTDKNTTYGFSQSGSTLTITPSEGEQITITLGEEITYAKIVTALGFTPANIDNVPDQLSDLSDDATHRVVTDTQISGWNAKANKFVISSTQPEDQTTGDEWLEILS